MPTTTEPSAVQLLCNCCGLGTTAATSRLAEYTADEVAALTALDARRLAGEAVGNELTTLLDQIADRLAPPPTPETSAAAAGPDDDTDLET